MKSTFLRGLRTRRSSGAGAHGQAAEEMDQQADALQERAILARAVTAGAVAGAMAGAVAGATAAAATVQAGQLQRQCVGASNGAPHTPRADSATPATPSGAPLRSPGAAVSPPLLDSPGYGEWQRAYDDATSAWYYYSTRTREVTWTPPPGWVTHKASGSMHGEDLEMALAQTLTIDDFLHKSGIASHLGDYVQPQPSPQQQPRASSGSPPSLYARDTDIDTQEEVDPRVGVALDDMNNAMCAVNDLEAALTQAKRRARQLEAEQKQLCQAAYDKLSRGVKEALPVYNRQLLAKQQQAKTQRAFVEYQRAHDVHAEAKAAIAALEGELMASSGGAVVDTELLSQCSDLASRVVEAESAKLRADHVHAIEARRLSTLLRDLHSGPRISQEHTERATPYLAVKARAELLLGQAVERIKETEQQLTRAKQSYADAMSMLDEISRDIHEKRQQQAHAAALAANHAPPIAGEAQPLAVTVTPDVATLDTHGTLV